MSNDTNNILKSSVGRIISNTGTVLAHTKEALLKDLFEDLPSYFPGKTEVEYEDIITFLKTGDSPIGQFIEKLFTRLGYDISSFEKNRELTDLIKAVIAATISLSEGIKDLFSETDWMGEAQKLINNDIKKENLLSVKNLFKDPDLDQISGLSYGNKNFSIGIDFGDSKVFAVLKLILELITLIRKFRELEWDQMKREHRDFCNFIEESYFNKQFAERIFDHILATLLSNAKEIFAEDINAILGEVTKSGSELKEKIITNIIKQTGKAEAEVEKILEQINELREEISEIEKEIKEKLKDTYGTIYEEGVEIGNELLKQLSIRLKTAKGELEKLIKSVIKDYNKVGKTFSQLYAVLDFLNVIEKKSIQVAKYMPEKLPGINDISAFPTPDKDYVDVLVKKASGMVDSINKTKGQAEQEINDALSKLKALNPTVEIYVISWSKLEELFTHPIEYFKTLYPINDYDDAEALIKKVLDLVRLFNENIPDTSSIKQMLYEFMIRIWNAIKEKATPLDSDVKEALAHFENFIIDLLKVFEKYAIVIRDQLKEAFDDVKSIINKELSLKIQTNIQTMLAGNISLPGSNIKFTPCAQLTDSNFLNEMFVAPFVRIVGEKASEYDVFQGISHIEWEAAFAASASLDLSFNQQIIKEYKSVLGEIESYITDLVKPEKYKDKFDDLVKKLKTEFEKQTQGIPLNFAQVESFWKGAVSDLVQGNALDNPFSDFDITEYFNIFTRQLKELIPQNPDVYFLKFREVTAQSLNHLFEVNTNAAAILNVRGGWQKIDPAERAKQIRAFAMDVFASYWKELKSILYKNLVQPFVSQIEKTVKEWVKEYVLTKALELVKQGLSHQLNFSNYAEKAFEGVEQLGGQANKIYEEVSSTVEQAVDVAKNLLELTDQAQAIDSWSDGLQFAFKLYSLIPPKVKTKLSDLIGLPDWDFSGVKLPEYKLDMQNKFLAVTLYEYKYEDEETHNLELGVSFKLLAFIGNRDNKTGIFLLPLIGGKFGMEFSAGQNHKLDLKATADLNKEVAKSVENKSKEQQNLEKGLLGFFFTSKKNEKGKLNLSADFISDSSSVQAFLELMFSRKDTTEPVRLIGGEADDILTVTMKDYPQKIYVGYKDRFDFGYVGKVEDLQIKLALNKLNDFFKAILNDDLNVTLEDLELSYSWQDGFRFDGAYKVRLPLKTTFDIKALKISNLNLELGSGNMKNLVANLITNMNIDFKGIAFSLSEMGFGLDINYMKPTGGFGDFNIAPNFHFPTGLGISIDTNVVQGAGVIKWNKEKGEFLGAIELSIMDLCSASALVLFNTKMPDGSKGFSFMGALSVNFNPGIQLSMGFSLTGLGGSLGLNRKIEQHKLIDSVRSGSMKTMLIGKDLVNNLDAVLAEIASFYPTQKEQFFFGFLGEITWLELFKIDLGLFVQAPNPVVIIIAGGLHFTVSDDIAAIHVYFSGGIDFSKGLFFDASLVDSHIASIKLEGDMALRIYWSGDTRGFLFSAGGFHPMYTPAPGFYVSDLKRLAIRLDWKIIKLSLETYIAITSNTVQFGANIKIVIGWKKFGVSGYLYLDALFQFNPFHFLIDMGAGVAVKCGSWTLMSINLAFTLGGPAKWVANGKAKFYFLFIPIKVSFNFTWGKSQEVTDKKLIDLMPLFVSNFSDNGNWKITSGDLVDGLVEIAQQNEIQMTSFDPEEESNDNYTQYLVIQSSDIVSFSQSAVPIGQELECYGESLPGDVKKITVKNILLEKKTLIPKQEWQQNDAYFAPTLIRKLEENEKLKASSFEPMSAGFDLTFTSETKAGNAIEIVTENEYGYQLDEDRWQDYLIAREKSAIKEPSTHSTSPLLDSVGIRKQMSPTTAITQKMNLILQKNPRRSVRAKKILIEKVLETEPRSDVQRFAKQVDKLTYSKATTRRTRDGFKRYTAELDKKMKLKI